MAINFRGMAPLLQVFDMPTAIRFYRDILGFGIVSASSAGDDSDWVWLHRDGVDLMLNTAYEADERPAAPDPARTTSHSDLALFISCREVDDVYEHLRNQRISVDPPRNAPYGMRQLYVTDPDGYVVCFQWPASGAEGTRWDKWYGDDRIPTQP